MRALGSFFRSIYNNKRSFVGFVILLLFVLMATVGPALVPLSMKSDFKNRYLFPSLQHFLGTDSQGHDIFAMLVHGSRDVLSIGLLSASFVLLIGFTMGALAGFIGGVVDRVIDFVANIFLTLPQVPVLLVLTAFVKVSHPIVLSLIIALLSWASLARVVRSQIMAIKNREYIAICNVMGFNKLYIIFVEILPNLISFLPIQAIAPQRRNNYDGKKKARERKE